MKAFWPSSIYSLHAVSSTAVTASMKMQHNKLRLQRNCKIVWYRNISSHKNPSPVCRIML